MKRTQVMGGLFAAIAICCLTVPGALRAGKGGGGNNSGAPPTPINYSVTFFGPLVPGRQIYPSGMNNHAQVVGSGDVGGNYSHAFVYDGVNDVLVDLNDQFQADGLTAPDGGLFAFDDTTQTGWIVAAAEDINDSGQIACRCFKLSGGTAVDASNTRYTPAGSPTGTARLDVLDVPDKTIYPSAINNDGDVTGGAFLWTDAHIDTATGWLIANPLPHAAVDVNDDDGSGWVQIIGGNHRYTVNVNTLEVTDDFDLGTLFPKSRDHSEYSDSINNAGDVIGVSTDWKPLGTVNHGYRYRDRDGLVDLGTLGGKHSGADGINKYGDVVGSSDTSTGEFRLYLYSDAFGGMTDLSAALSVNYPNVVLTDSCGCTVPTAINDSGEICGPTPDRQQGYILIPQP